MGISITKPLFRASTYHLSSVSYADWPINPDDRKSTSGFCAFMGLNLITWSDKMQKTMSRSSTGAEYRILFARTTEIIWLQALIRELTIVQPHVPILWCDNSTIALAGYPVFHARSKQNKLDLYFTRKKISQGLIIVNHVPSYAQIVDSFTKALPTTHFKFLRSKLTVSPSTLSLRGDINHIAA